MKDIKAIRGNFYIHRLIGEGEHEHQDFKFAISDARKIARSISAFANNDGGRLLIGVKDNGHITGVRNEEDIYMIEHAAESYCDPPQQVEVSAFVCEGGAVVLRAAIARAAARPVFCIEEHGRRVAYYRVGDENITAHPLMVRAWRLRERGGAEATPLTDGDFALLRHLSEAGTTTPEDYMLAAHISKAAAEMSVVRLMAAGMVEMVHTPSGFCLRHCD